jgi:hypothetical protein
MTPDELNRITRSVHADLEVAAIEPLAKAYKRLLRGAGRRMARKLRAQAVSLTASIVPPNEDEVIPEGLGEQVDRLTARERAELVKLLVAAYEAHEIAWDVKPSITPELLEKVGAHATFATEADLRAVYRGVIQTAAEEGYSIPRTANAIVETVDGIAEYRAVALARTDLIGLANGASQAIATDAFAGREDVTKVWLATEDDRTRETHVDANGQEVSLNDYFDVGGYSAMYPGDPDLPDEEVINCVLGDAKVVLPGLAAVTRRRYEGEVVKVRTRRTIFTVTPNHPILALGEGWKQADELRPGDRLLRPMLREGVGEGDPDIENVKPCAAQIFDALAETPERISGMDMDFHGDGIIDQDVDVVRANSRLLTARETRSPERTREAVLTGTDLRPAALPTQSLRDGFGQFDAPLAASMIRNLHASASLLGSHLRGTDAVRLGAATRLNARCKETTANGRTTYSEVLCDARLALSAEVSPDEVISVERHSFSGHVYNFDTGMGWYIADGILHRNCRCTLVYSGASGEETATEEAIVSSAVLPEAYSAAMDNHVTAAVTITVEDDTTSQDTERQRTAWEGILAIEGSPTSDGRYLIPGEIGERDLPLPIAASHEDQRATETVGRIELIEHIPAADFEREGWELPDDLPPQAVVIWGEGTFDGSDDADDAMRQMENGVGISLDLPMERQALIDAQTYEEVDLSVLTEEQMLAMMFGSFPEGYLRGIAGKIGGASLASIAAFEETVIRIVENSAIVASGFAIRERESIQPLVLRTDADPNAVALIASVQPPLAPPRDWFFIEEPDEPTPMTILPTGEFYGHLALWNTCHAGRSNGAYSSCMYAPHSRTGYSQFHLGAMLCDDGAEVPVGRITIGTGHAALNLGAAAARKHYDNTGTCVGYARAKDGVFGIWLSGVVKSDATAEAIRDFRACPPSGDWRAHDGALELQAALAVNVPGYVVPRSQLSLAASADSLEIATLILGPPDSDDRDEALRAEFDLQLAEDVDMLVELGVGEFCGVELAAINRVDFRDYSDAERRRMARSGEALPDGSFPIANCTDASNAISAQGRGGASQQRIVSHIRKRVRSLGCSGPIFEPYR